MVTVRIEDKPAFTVAGRRVWISGQDNEQFGRFWAEAHANGLIDRLRALRQDQPGPITASLTFGVSCVDEDPDNRAFDFYIAAETDGPATGDDLERRVIPACKWAIFANRGALPGALIESEMHAFMEWLPQSGYAHDNAPELEVYPAHDGTLAEFWLPIKAK